MLKPQAGKCPSSCNGYQQSTDQSAYWALPGYTFKGVYKELQKHFGPSDQNYIIAARTAQGFEELSKSTEAERMEVIHRWQATLLELEKQTESAKHRCH